MSETYVAIVGSAVGNDRDGFEVVHNWDGLRYPTKALAVKHGFKLGVADDFNIGVVRDGKLASLWWMDEQISEDDATLDKIGQEIGLRRPA